MLLPVIMAGGSGTRLWPLSRASRPKQFHPLAGERSMLQETILRLEGLEALAPLVICNDRHRTLATQQLDALGQQGARLLLEPVGRNTAPALALAALAAPAICGGDPVLLALPADHVVSDIPRLHAALRTGTQLAEDGAVVAFGIVPDRAEPGYGHIRPGAPLADGSGFVVAAFEEKPDRATAARYVTAGHYWNSGMFMVRASRYLGELERHRPDILAACRDAIDTRGPGPLRVDADAFARCASISVDRAVMERTDAAVVVPLDAGWSDIGTWTALGEVSDADEQGNVVRGDVVALDSRDSLAIADTRRLVLLGVDNLVVVETADAVLVAHRDSAADVGLIADMIARGKQDG